MQSYIRPLRGASPLPRSTAQRPEPSSGAPRWPTGDTRSLAPPSCSRPAMCSSHQAPRSPRFWMPDAGPSVRFRAASPPRTGLRRQRFCARVTSLSQEVTRTGTRIHLASGGSGNRECYLSQALAADAARGGVLASALLFAVRAARLSRRALGCLLGIFEREITTIFRFRRVLGWLLRPVSRLLVRHVPVDDPWEERAGRDATMVSAARACPP